MNHEIRKRALSLLQKRLTNLDPDLEFEISRAIDEAELSLIHDELNGSFDEYSRRADERSQKIMKAFDEVQTALLDTMEKL